MSTFVTRTPLSNLRPLGTDAERSFERIVAIVSQHTSAAHAAMLADPVPARDGSAIDWYADGEDEVRPLAALSADEQSAVRAALERNVGDILAAADAAEANPAQRGVVSALRNAMTFPEDNALWAVRTGSDWTPLIVGWSYTEHDTVTPRPFQVTAYGRSRADTGAKPSFPGPINAAGAASGAASTGMGSAATGGLAGSGAVHTITERRGRIGAWLWPLLLLLAALVLAILVAAFLLPACGLRTPLGTITFGLPAPACDIGADADRAAASGRADDLRRELEALEDQYRRERLQCLIPPGNLPQLDPTSPTLTDEDPPAEEFSERIENRGDVQVTLIWNSTDDLDLQVVCPGGRIISFSQTSGCGGVLDVDANDHAGTANNSPVENITFSGSGAAIGNHTVRVSLFNARSGRLPVSFSVRVRDGDNEQVYQGTLSVQRDPVTVATFDR